MGYTEISIDDRSNEIIQEKLYAIFLTFVMLASLLPVSPCVMSLSARTTAATLRDCCCGTGLCKMDDCPGSKSSHAAGFAACSNSHCIAPISTPITPDQSFARLMPSVRSCGVLMTIDPTHCFLRVPTGLQHCLPAPPDQPPRIC